MRFYLFSIFAFLGFVFPTLADEPDRREIEFFENKIRPVLVKSCYKCHSANAKRLRGGLLLDSRKGLLEGGDTGPAIKPGDPKKSLLISALRHNKFEMPPNGKLPKSVISDFVAWIKMGAPDPRDLTKTKVAEKVIDLEKARKFWAFQKPEKHEVPMVKDKNWVKDPLDQFVLAKLEEKNLPPVSDAPPRTLLRRLYIDLIGLPPTPEEVKKFVKDYASSKQTAIEEVVDRLLSSQHFGERWGRHWLDVARYAESNGGAETSRRPFAWRYRDYVIKAFNEDKPYNEFVREQVAGDLLPAKNAEQRKNQIVATGFLANGVHVRGKRMDDINEQMDTLGRAFLGMSIGCARCHDHKFDPISTKDYYALAGIFLNAQPMDCSGSSRNQREYAKVDKRSVNDFKKFIQGVGGQEERIRQYIREIKEETREREVRYDLTKSLEENVKAIPERNRRRAQSRLESLQKAKSELEKLLRPKGLWYPPFAVSMEERGANRGKMGNARIHIRGSEKNLGDEVPRGLPEIFGEVKIPEDASGRVQFADWIAGEENPLTARVMVNRIWHHLFSRGLVQTVDNFGKLGERPTHPELLDNLAVAFMENGWSVKKMIRRIVLSRTYQLSSEFSKANFKVDPDNEFHWRHRSRRLGAETLRDSILSVSGQLDPEPMHGSLVKGFGSFRGWMDINHEKHRTVYLPILRGGVPPLLSAFNFPPPSLVVGNRQSTTVPTQALFLLNSPWVMVQAEYTALEIMKKEKSQEERVELAYLLTMARPANSEEESRALQFLAAYRSEETEDKKGAAEKRRNGEPDNRDLEAWTALCQSLFASGDFLFVQ